MFIATDELPLPYEYRFLALDGLVTEAPSDLDERTIVFLDCGNINRNPAAEVLFAKDGPGADPEHRSSPRQHPVRDRELRRPRLILHRRADLGPGTRARRRAARHGSLMRSMSA